jgi:hypothetical protein
VEGSSSVLSHASQQQQQQQQQKKKNQNTDGLPANDGTATAIGTSSTSSSGVRRVKAATMGARAGARFVKSVDLDRKKMEPEEFAEVYSQVRHNLRPTPTAPQEKRSAPRVVRQLDFRGTIKDTGWLAELLRQREGERVYQAFEGERGVRDSGELHDAEPAHVAASEQVEEGAREQEKEGAREQTTKQQEAQRAKEEAQQAKERAHREHTQQECSSTDSANKETLAAQKRGGDAGPSVDGELTSPPVSEVHSTDEMKPADLSASGAHTHTASGATAAALAGLSNEELSVRWGQNQRRLRAAAQRSIATEGGGAAQTLGCVQCAERMRTVLLLPCRHAHRCVVCQSAQETRCLTCDLPTVGRLSLRYV